MSTNINTTSPFIHHPAQAMP